jgi:hypothetical protein
MGYASDTPSLLDMRQKYDHLLSFITALHGLYNFPARQGHKKTFAFHADCFWALAGEALPAHQRGTAL